MFDACHHRFVCLLVRWIYLIPGSQIFDENPRFEFNCLYSLAHTKMQLEIQWSPNCLLLKYIESITLIKIRSVWQALQDGLKQSKHRVNNINRIEQRLANSMARLVYDLIKVRMARCIQLKGVGSVDQRKDEKCEVDGEDENVCKPYRYHRLTATNILYLIFSPQ